MSVNNTEWKNRSSRSEVFCKKVFLEISQNSQEITKVPRTPFFTEHLRWLLLYGISSGPYFPVFSPNTGKYGPEKTPYLDIFHELQITVDVNKKYKENI